MIKINKLIQSFFKINKYIYLEIYLNGNKNYLKVEFKPSINKTLTKLKVTEKFKI